MQQVNGWTANDTTNVYISIILSTVKNGLDVECINISLNISQQI